MERHLTGVLPGFVRSLKAVALVAGLGICVATAGAGRAQEEKIPLPIKLPKPVFAGTAANVKAGSNVEKISTVKREIPMVPKGTVNLALHKKVTSSAPPFSGTLDQITDGDKEAKEDTAVELKPKLQWVQIDLGATSPLYYVAVWHFHLEPIIFHAVVIQASNDPNFVEGVTTLFNNDVENLAGLGVGKDKEYFETNEGKLIDAKGVKARYIRLYSKGSTYRDSLNRYTEVEVYGQPAR
ncbi:MAG TPA: discoidin domain-containing protein [Chthonomonadaceae bacterium]|nr:discoidin domain-containing protein [Chthonomonadaceae bacterium]